MQNFNDALCDIVREQCDVILDKKMQLVNFEVLKCFICNICHRNMMNEFRFDLFPISCFRTTSLIALSYKDKEYWYIL